MLLRLLGELFRGKSEEARPPRVQDTPLATQGDAAAVDPRLARCWALEQAGRMSAALECYKACAHAHPDWVEAHLANANALSSLWRMDECIAALTRAAAASPRDAQVYSTFLLFGHYASHPDARALFHLHRRFGDIVAPSPEACAGAFRNTRDPARRLRVGYVSRNLSRHSVGYFVEPVLARHDAADFEVFCYYTHPHADDATKRMAALAHTWRQVDALSDDALARAIRDDGIDVLVDLGGHTKLNRLGVFARRPAPVQVTWLGYPNTTGVPAIGYRITDAIADPAPHSDRLYTERLLRLDGAFVCYRPPDDSPAVVAREDDAAVVFGSMNVLAKVNVRGIELWSRILSAVPGSRLVMKSRTLGERDAAAAVLAAFETHGIERWRIELRGWAADQVQHLAAYGGVDIALDTFPYNGTTTTCEALWMGVPVVTLAGDMHISRVGASLLAAAGLPELVASTAEQYVEIAVGLACDTARRRSLRSAMRSRLEASPLLDHAAYTRRFESVLRSAWSEWCASGAPGAA